MKNAFVLCALAACAGASLGCGEDTPGTGGSGGSGGSDVIGPLTWDVSEYTVVVDDPEDEGCDAVSLTEDITAFEIVIAGTGAVLESLDLVAPTGDPLGGIADPYGPEQDVVVFEASFQDGPSDDPDCVVDVMDTFTVELDDPTVSLDQNETVQVTWDHDEMESMDSASEGACDVPVWFVQLPCSSQATFTLTQRVE